MCYYFYHYLRKLKIWGGKKRVKCPNQDQVNYASLVRTSSDTTQIFFSVSKERFRDTALVLLSPALLIQVLGRVSATGSDNL